MHTLLYALAQHEDIAKFELEDGLVREAAASLLAHPSTISDITIDTLTSATFDDRLPEGAGTSPRGFDALLRITASDERDTRPNAFDELVMNVARVVGRWPVTTREITSRSDSWRGTSTPGVKLNLLLSRGPGIDLSSYEGWLLDEVQAAVERTGSVGVRSISPIQGGDPASFDTLLEFSLPSQELLTSTLDEGHLSGILESELLDPAQLRVFATSEHVLTPNENAWELSEGAGRSISVE